MVCLLTNLFIVDRVSTNFWMQNARSSSDYTRPSLLSIVKSFLVFNERFKENEL